jgi:hypothetical protein
MKSRLSLLLVLVAIVAGAVMLLSSDPAPTTPPKGTGRQVDTTTALDGDGLGSDAPDGDETVAELRAPFVSASECRDCHADVYGEWERSYHGMAWTDPMVQALSNGFRMTECIDCHAPQPIHVTGVDRRVAPRQHARGDGVDCISCHLLEDGVSVASSRTVDTAAVAGACRPVAVETMSVSTVCAGCHNQHETVDELLASGVQAECQTCHMAEVERTVGEGSRQGRSHLFPGAHSEEMHRRAVKLDVRVAGGKVLAEVVNVGAAHKVPTDARHRSYNVWVDAWDARGNPIVFDQQMTEGEFRLYYRDDFRPSTQLAHKEPRTATWAIPQGFKGRVLVRLTYALNPEELAARRLFDVHRQEVEIP